MSNAVFAVIAGLNMAFTWDFTDRRMLAAERDTIAFEAGVFD